MEKCSLRLGINTAQEVQCIYTERGKLQVAFFLIDCVQFPYTSITFTMALQQLQASEKVQLDSGPWFEGRGL